MAVTFYADEQTPTAVVDGLRERGVGVVSFLDVYPHGTEDAVHLAHATEQRYVVLTRDTDFFRLQDAVWAGEEVPAGVVYVLEQQWKNVGLQIRVLVEIDQKETPESMMGKRVWIS